MLSRKLHPPIHLLRAFAHTAQLQSISRAAEVLALTQSAVSKQVLELESLLGVPLFERIRKRLVLTPAGQRYWASVDAVLKRLEQATLDVMALGDSGGVLNVATLPTFGAKWLIPRLHGFSLQHPKVSLNFLPHVQAYDFHLPELDCAVRYGAGTWPGALSIEITGRRMVVIAPVPTKGSRRLRKPKDLANWPLLHHQTVPLAWAQWCEHHAVTGIEPHKGMRMDQYTSLIRAVMAGMGAALVPVCLVRDDIAAGIVSAPFEERWDTDQSYHLVYPEAKAHLPALIAFSQWLQAEGKKCQGSAINPN
jgi:DNA-binding transcriptional LysR family regulator